MQQHTVQEGSNDQKMVAVTLQTEAIGCALCRTNTGPISGRDIACSNPKVVEQSGVHFLLSTRGTKQSLPQQIALPKRTKCEYGERRRGWE